MNRILNHLLILSILFLGIATACSDSGSGPAPVEGELAEDIPGDLNTIFETPSPVVNIAANINTLIETHSPVADVEGDTDANPGYTFYDLDTGEIVSDSLSDSWDIGFGGTTVIANSGNGGGIQVVNEMYADLEEAPASGYEAETASQSWYTYTAMNEPQHAILAKEDQTVVVQTPDGKYAKVQILSYYQGNPDTSTEEFTNLATRPPSNYFTFSYTLQTKESNDLVQVDNYTYYNLDAGETVGDASSAEWDVAFNGTTIMANADNGGGVQVVSGAYADVEQAPTSGYSAETGSGSWYNYDFNTHIITPKEDQTVVVQTPDGNYAKLEILSYYKDSEPSNESRYYTFNYLIKTNGETQLYHNAAYTYFDLETGEIVEDASSAQWDLGFQATTIIANTENGGGILSLDIPYSDLTEAPTNESDYKGEASGWYTYTGNNPPAHAVLVKEGVSLVVHTPDGNYAKIRMISYYKGNPDTSTEEFVNNRPPSRYFTFEYGIQADGSAFFE